MHMTFLPLICSNSIYIPYEHFLVCSPQFSVHNHVILHSELNDFCSWKRIVKRNTNQLGLKHSFLSFFFFVLALKNHKT
jgi:hypothetical protein